MTIALELELKRLRKAAGEAVRRGIEESDWLSECVPHLANRVGEPADRLDHTFATNICHEDMARGLRRRRTRAMKPVHEQIREFVLSNFYVGETALDDDTPLLDGIIDSDGRSRGDRISRSDLRH